MSTLRRIRLTMDMQGESTSLAVPAYAEEIGAATYDLIEIHRLRCLAEGIDPDWAHRQITITFDTWEDEPCPTPPVS